LISIKSHTKEWIFGIREGSPGKDPILIEKMIMAFTLIENLKVAGLDFIFKGGTALHLLLGSSNRFSIDIDIILPNPINLDSYLTHVLNQGNFFKVEEIRRSGSIPKQHYKFYYQSAIQNKESQILLDILFDYNLYPKLVKVPIKSPLLLLEGDETVISCPTKDCILGDKLTAFAPHTTGIPYGIGKDLEIAKQLFDISMLFNEIEDLRMVETTFVNIAIKELAYREMTKISFMDVLWDSLNTSILIGTRGLSSTMEYGELVNGFRKMAGFVFKGNFTLDSAILCASRVAYLSALLIQKSDKVEWFQNQLDLSSWVITDLNFNKLNKLKKTDPEAFYYYFKALDLLKLCEAKK